MVQAVRRPLLSLIAAVARNGAIGQHNGLLWHEPEDQKHFKRLTMGCPVIMGRKTWDSLPQKFRPLPGRRNIVITSNRDFAADGADAVASLDAAMSLIGTAEKAFVIGGAQIYALALPLADELALTEIDAELAGDTFFPMWDKHGFELVSSDAGRTADGVGYRFVLYRRNPAG